MPNQHVQLVEKFYSAFKDKDAETMITCYHKDLEFEDPAFGPLDYEKTCAMWRMLVEAGKDLEINFKNVWSENVYGGADWEAKYTFGKTGRKVHNKIDAKFRFKDGLIVGHRDYFDFYKWAKMALGMPAVLLGWTGFFKKKVRAQVLERLDKHMNQNA